MGLLKPLENRRDTKFDKKPKKILTADAVHEKLSKHEQEKEEEEEKESQMRKDSLDQLQEEVNELSPHSEKSLKLC